MPLHKVRVTQEPDVVREVTDAELTDLYRQGILHSFERTAEAKAIVPDAYMVAAKWKGPKSDELIVTAPEPTTAPYGAVTGVVNEGDDSVAPTKTEGV